MAQGMSVFVVKAALPHLSLNVRLVAKSGLCKFAMGDRLTGRAAPQARSRSRYHGEFGPRSVEAQYL